MKIHAIIVFASAVWSVNAFAQTSCCMKPSATDQFAMLSADESFQASHLNPMPFEYQAQKGTMISFSTPDGSTGKAFEIKADKPTKKTVIVFHEWWGLNDYIKQEAEKIQQELGDVNVYAIDLYDGKIATTKEVAGQYMGELKDDRARAIIDGLYMYIGNDAKIATIGWCLGGGWSMQGTLMADNKSKACVIYYGMPEKNLEKIKKMNAPVLGIFATKDQWISGEVVKQFEADMKAANKKLTIANYDADHAFANPSNPQFDKEKAADAHKKAIDFIRKNLK